MFTIAGKSFEFLTCNHVTKSDDATSVRHVGGILISNMASSNKVSSRTPVLSEYCNSLSGPAKARYKDKVDICGFDPYSLKNSDFEDDPERLPTVKYPDIFNYFVLQTSWVTKQQMKAYKSLEACNFFVSGWVSKLQRKQVGTDKSCVFARVSNLSVILF